MRPVSMAVPLLVVAAAASGCLGASDPISARNAYDRAIDALEAEGRFENPSFVGIVGIEGELPAGLETMFQGDDARSKAYENILRDGDYRDDHPDGRLGDGRLGHWAVLFLVDTPGDDTRSLLTYFVASGNGGPGSSLNGPPGGQRVVADLDDCPAPDLASWKVTSVEAAAAARGNSSFRAGVDANPDGAYVYDFVMDEGFYDGCGSGKAQPYWQVSYVALTQGDAVASVTALIDATTGDVIESDAIEVKVADLEITGDVVTLLDAKLSFSNPVPCDAGCGTAGDDPEIGRFTLEVGARDVDAHFTLTQTGQTVFADACRLWRGEGETDLVEQAAFNGGVCDLHVDRLQAGLYRAVFSTDQLDPTGRHEVTALVTGVL